MKKRLIVLVGIPGSGKTTFAMNYIRKYNDGHMGYTGKEKYVNMIGKDKVHLLTDEHWDKIRDKVYKDMEEMLTDNDTRVIIYDETNTTEKYLLNALRTYKAINSELSIEFFMFDDSLNESLCKERMTRRDRRGIDADDQEKDYFRRQAYKYTIIRDLVAKNQFHGLVDRILYIENFQVKQEVKFPERSAKMGSFHQPSVSLT